MRTRKGKIYRLTEDEDRILYNDLPLNWAGRKVILIEKCEPGADCGTIVLADNPDPADAHHTRLKALEPFDDTVTDWQGVIE